ncbi:MAG: hypothetical protein IJW73_07775 [Candidatus Gastranaerophilales bacterium]|nr:hypothetical protein [Candidatus Gastranaerophilales bacterium]
MSKRIFFGFSLVEILVALIAVSCISAALAPVITKKLKSNAITVGSMGGKMEFVVDCSTWGDDCVFCTEEKCSLCTKDCNDNEFVFTQDCICKNCSEVDANCVQCTAKKCKKCQAGYGLVNYRCEQCSAGTYSDGTTECLKAPAGYYVASAGQGSATPCGAGTYQNEEGKTSCKTCSAGSYQDETGKSSCKTCEIDYMCTGGNNRTQCAANYGANAGSSSCSPCSSYCADCQVPNVCLRCNAGFYLNNNTCYPCTVGYSCDGSVNQTVCPAGYYSGAGANSCTACAAGTYSSGGVESCSSCSAGSYSSAGASSCTSCSAGYYAAAGSSSCTKCSAGTYAPAGASSCSACSSGYYSSAGASSCTKCSSTWAHCTACTASGCTACATDYKVENGKCVEDTWCKGSQMIKISSTLCMTRCNLGDCWLPLDNTSSQGACWRDPSSNCNGINGSYSGCGRYLCNWHAANSGCDNLTLGNHSNWRLPTEAELKTGMKKVDAMFCDGTSSTTFSVCQETTLCSGVQGNRCIPYMAWANVIEYRDGDYYCNHCQLQYSSVHCSGGAVSGCGAHPMSVRCVHAL